MPYSFRQGHVPLLVSIPHNGSFIPHEIQERMTPEGCSSADTDWFLDRLYDFPELESASLLVATHSRYVVDLNRPVNDDSLYPGQTTTGLIPTERFDGLPIYEAEPPDEAEVTRRIEEIWKPYHQRLQLELNRLVNEFGKAILLDAHSIASKVPRLFDGRLPDFNIGTNHDKSCDPSLGDRIIAVLQDQQKYSHVKNGRFVGGYITRNYGDPEQRVHAVQFELSQITYMDEPTGEWDLSKASEVQPLLRALTKEMLNWIADDES